MFFGARTKSVGFKPTVSKADLSKPISLKTFRPQNLSSQNLLNVKTLSVKKVDF
jgi:hypothetical protein